MASERVLDHVSIRIDEKLRATSPTSFECSVFKVPDRLRRVNEKAYEPQILAIGPYHHGKGHLREMEEHKIRYLQMLLERREENNTTRYVMALRALEERARKCYAGHVSLDIDDFVEMMLLDGCFIVELIRKLAMGEWSDNSYDPIFNERWIFGSLKRDILLLENQLPFFVIWKLFEMTVMESEPNNFILMTSVFLKIIFPGLGLKLVDRYPIQGIRHLLEFIHVIWLPSHEMEAYYVKNNNGLKFIRCTRELREAGIKFKKVKGESLLDIKFKNGVMEIPTLNIVDSTEPFFRNLIAYEQCLGYNNPTYVTDYVTFMDCLINSPMDVELLRQYGIIDNFLGEDEVTANMFNRLGDGVTLSVDFYYSEIFNNVNMYCSGTWNKWRANLRHNYFNTPWSSISFVAASLLLLLTLAQTVFSVLSYLK